MNFNICQYNCVVLKLYRSLIIQSSEYKHGDCTFLASSVWKGDENLEKLQITHLTLHELAAAVLINQNTKRSTLNIELSLDSFSRKGMKS